MKKSAPGLKLLFAFLVCLSLTGADRPALAAGGVTEYAMIRFDGLRHSHVIWPDGKVEFIGSLVSGPPAGLQNFDERIYALTVLMNHLSKQGFEFVVMFTNDQVLMKRTR